MDVWPCNSFFPSPFPSFFLSVSLIHLSISSLISLSLYAHLYLSFNQSIYHYVYIFFYHDVLVCISFLLFISLSMYSSVCVWSLFFPLYLYICIYLFTYIYLFLYLSIYPSFLLSFKLYCLSICICGWEWTCVGSRERVSVALFSLSFYLFQNSRARVRLPQNTLIQKICIALWRLLRCFWSSCTFSVWVWGGI